MSSIPKTIANFETSLATKISSSASAMDLATILTDDGVVIPDGIYGATVDQGTNAQEHMIITISGGSASVAITVRGVSVIDGVTNIPALQFPHDRGATVKFTDHPILIRVLRALNGVEALDGVPQLPAARVIDSSRDVTDKEYVDSVAGAAGGISAFLVSKNGADPTLTINVGAGTLIAGSTPLTYAGASAQAVTASQTNYVQLTIAGVLVINTSSFVDGNIPLATVVCDGTTITSVTDKRPWLTMALTPDQIGALAGTSGAPSGSNPFVTDDDTTATPTAGAIPRGDEDGTLSAWVQSFEQSFTALEDITAGEAVALTTMTIAYDNASTSSTTSDTNTFNHSVGNIKNGVIIIHIFTGSTAGLSAVTVGGAAATLITSRQIESDKFLYSYYFLTSTPGTVSVSATRVSGGGSTFAITAISYSGVHQTTPIDASASAASNSVNELSLSVTSTVVNDVVTGIAYGDAGSALTLSNNIANQRSSLGSNQIKTFDTQVLTAAAYSFRIAQGGGADGEGMILVALKPVASGTAGIIRAIASSPGPANVLGFAKETAASGASVAVRLAGIIGGLSGPVPGKQQFLSNNTYGALTTTQPTGYAAALGLGTAANQINFQKSNTFAFSKNGAVVTSGNSLAIPIACGFDPKVVKIFMTLTATTTYSSVLMEIRGSNILLTYVMTNAPAIVALQYNTTVTLGAATFTVSPTSDHGIMLTLASTGATSTIGTFQVIAE